MNFKRMQSFCRMICKFSWPILAKIIAHYIIKAIDLFFS